MSLCIVSSDFFVRSITPTLAKNKHAVTHALILFYASALT